MLSKTSWRLVYGGIYVALIAASIFAAAMSAGGLLHDTTKAMRSGILEALPITLGIYALFSALERVVPAAGPRKPVSGYILNFKLTLLEVLPVAFFGSMVGACVAIMGNRFGLGWIDLRFSTGHRIVDLILAFLLSQFIFDFFFYWYHRFQHESFLWEEHKLHHMDEQLCAFTRQSWLEELVSGPLTTIPLAILFKLNPAQGAIAGALFTAWVVFLHSNIRLHLGPLSVLFNGPQGHRIHHSRVKEHHDRNYAAFFPVWDVIFGTYHYPKRDEYPLTGVHDEKEVETFSEAATLAFRGWWKIFVRWRDGSPLP
jgi:sterol desaturase/sphingolipid hydroxylase (fatty acid hydroxylase superfamily)